MGWRTGSRARRVATVALALVLSCSALAGCAKEPPPVVRDANLEMRGTVAAEHARLSLPAGGELTVSTGPLYLYVDFDPPPSKRWLRTGVVVEGQQPQLVNQPAGPWPSLILFGEGQPGEPITLALSAMVQGSAGQGSGDNVYRLVLRRVANPAPDLFFLRGGEWVKLAGEVIKVRPLTLRLCFDRDMDATSVAPVFRDFPQSWAWADARTIEIELGASPPPVIDIPLSVYRGGTEAYAIHDAVGIPVVESLLTVYTRDPAEVLSYDPSTGKVQSLYAAPPNLYSGELSPDGKTLLIGASRNRDFEHYTEKISWLVDLATGERQQNEWKDARWLDDTHVGMFPNPALQVVGLDGTVQPELGLEWAFGPEVDWRWFAVSPDGSRLAGFASGQVVVIDYDAEADKVAWLSTGDDRGQPRALVAWSPEGDKILAARGSIGGPGLDLVVVDIAKDDHTLAATLEDASGEVDIAWSPDGAWWLVGGTLVGVEEPHARKAVAIPAKYLDGGYAEFSPDGRYLALGARTGWKPLAIYDTASGKVVDLGEAIP